MDKNTYKNSKAVILGFINKAKENKPPLGDYLDKHFSFDDIKKTLTYTGDVSAFGNLVDNSPRPTKDKSECFDCKRDTSKNPRDYYMVIDSIWKEYGVGKNNLCMSCLEKRIGRTLEKSDILECPVTNEWNPYTSNILKK